MVSWGKVQRKPGPPSSQKAVTPWKPKGEVSKVAGISLKRHSPAKMGVTWEWMRIMAHIIENNITNSESKEENKNKQNLLLQFGAV